MRITQQQLSILDSFIVERLRTNADNALVVNSFASAKNPFLAERIKQEDSLHRDLSGTTAYYLVKTQKGELLLYFSLKCGELYVNLDKQKMDLAINTYNALSMLDYDKESTEYKNAFKFLSDNINEIKSYWPDIDAFFADSPILLSKKNQYLMELQNEINNNMQRVLRTYPAIEIVEFCVNDNAKSIWKSLNMPPKRRMGECIFWHYIVPKIQAIQELIGCQYIYLFAADSTSDRYLENYYKTVLKVEKPEALGANKPQYDFNCSFLCQELNKMIKERDLFYNDFNPDEDEV